MDNGPSPFGKQETKIGHGQARSLSRDPILRTRPAQLHCSRGYEICSSKISLNVDKEQGSGKGSETSQPIAATQGEVQRQPTTSM